MRVANKNSSPSRASSGATGKACNEILKGSAVASTGQAGAQCRKLTTCETYAALTVTVPLVVCRAMPILAAETEGMLSAGVGNIVHTLEGLVRRGEQRPPVIAPQLIETVYVDLWQTEVRGIGHSRVDAINGRRIRSMVSRKDRLPETIETEARFIDPAGIRHPGIIEAENLSSQLRLRFPLRAQHRYVEYCLKAVSKKVACRHAVTLVKVMVGLDDEIVIAILIWQSDIELGVIDAVRVGVRIGRIKRREFDAQCVHAAGAGGSRRASRSYAGSSVRDAVDLVSTRQAARHSRGTGSRK